ncbi:HSP20-like chaperone [Echria macrotheca]|uniref:HSP20-like chaperone n=1 Tax=Echria macrotheca TaxID=438768 RepID=A0AAJ0BHN9_9PEZI|nr:HSP20-like chaperone [Echria macrotheca]
MPLKMEKAMDFLPPALASNPNITHLIRLLDDIEKYSHHGCSHRAPAFQPRFDLIETADAFELYGDLPGVHKEDVSIELTDPRTLVVKGSITHPYGVFVPPHATPVPITPAVPTPIGEGVPAVPETPAEPAPTPAAPAVPQPTYLVSERGTGSFQRTFKLPLDLTTRDGIKAAFEDGVLKVFIPKPNKGPGDATKIQIQ